MARGIHLAMLHRKMRAAPPEPPRRLGIRTARWCCVQERPKGNRMRRTLQPVREGLPERMPADQLETERRLGQVLNGRLNYYAVRTS